MTKIVAKHALWCGQGLGRREELLDLLGDQVHFGSDRRVVGTMQRDVPCAGDVLGEVAALPGRDRPGRPGDEERASGH